jgi:hypothetical protein
MKVHKAMKNQLLIQEVTSQLSQRFTPKIPDIKKASFPPRSIYDSSRRRLIYVFLGNRHTPREGVH